MACGVITRTNVQKMNKCDSFKRKESGLRFLEEKTNQIIISNWNPFSNIESNNFGQFCW